MLGIWCKKYLDPTRKNVPIYLMKLESVLKNLLLEAILNLTPPLAKTNF